MTITFPIIAFLVLCRPIPGPEDSQGLAVMEVQKQAHQYFGSISRDPSLTSPIAGPDIQISLETTNLDSKRARAHIGLQRGDTTFHIKLEGPLGGGSDQTSWADLNGLANSVVADIGVSGYLWKPKPNKGLARAFDQYRSDYLRQGHSGEEWDALLERIGGTSSETLPCAYRQRYLKGSYGMPVQWGIHAQVGRQSYSYLDPVEYVDRETARTNYAIILFNGIVLPDSDLFLGLSYRYQSACRTGEPQKILIPTSDIPGALRLHELPIGEPERNNSNLGQLEARYFIGTQFAWNPKVTYSFNSKVLGIELPFYFLKNAKEGLNGGVSAGWRSDTKEWGIRFFIGNAIKVFKEQ